MRCASCGTDNRPDRKFCGACGARLAIACPSCGTVNVPGERFCGECGTALPASAGPASAAAPMDGTEAAGASAVARAADPAGGASAERRLVSVLFADLVGFTTLADRLDAEAVRELQRAYFDAVRGVIERYGGTVEKFIGDAVMAVWGAPVAFEDDAERAVRAGLDVVDAVAALRDTVSEPGLAARVGVLTGEAAVSLASASEAMVSGDLVNTASRLQSAAEPGTVLVGEATVRATEASIAYEPAGDRTLKGKPEPVPTWRAVRVVAGRRGAGRSDRLEAPFVGRATELRALKDALEAVGREGRARYVGIVGQAGIGKSRLAWELEKHVDGLVERVYWQRGRSPAYGDGVAYWAIGEMVRERARIAESDDAIAAAAKLDAMLGEYIADADDRAWIGPHLRVLLGLEPSAGADRTEQFAAWRRLFESIASLGTTVLVFEDLQWADAGVLDFIDGLFEWSRGLPILVVALLRPELLERRPDLGGRSHNTLRLHLEPLTPAETRELLVGLAPDLPESVVEAVVGRAEGVPLYAIELVRMVRAQPDGASRLDPSALSIPPSLQALVAARLDALPAPDRALLQDAAVLGGSFTLAALAAVAGRSEEDVEAALRSLVRREVIVLDVDPRSPERGQYGFVQAVVREVAYGTLGRRDRRSRHLAAARHFETLDDDALAPVLAAHYLEAYRAAPDGEQGAAIRVQARLALRAAAERAARLHNDEQAFQQLEQALDLFDEPGERAAVLERQAGLAESAARFEAAIEKAEAARAAYEALGDGSAAARATGLLGSVELKVGRHGEAHGLLLDAIASLDPDQDPLSYARIAALLARVQMLAGNGRDAVEWADRALAAAGPLRNVEIIAEALNTKGTSLQVLNRLDESMALIRAAIELAAAHHLSNAELRARFNLAGRLFGDDPLGAIEIQRGMVEVAERTGRMDWWYIAMGSLAGGCVPTGLWDEAVEVAARLAGREEAPPIAQAEAMITQAEVAAARGERGAVERAIAAVESFHLSASDPQRRSEQAIVAADAALMEGRLQDVEAAVAGVVAENWRPIACNLRARAAVRGRDADAAERALRDADAAALGGNVFDANNAAIGAAVAILRGDRERGLAAGVDALRRLRALNVPLFLANADLDLVTALGSNDPAARPLADEARAIFEALGARALLDRLDETMDRPASAQPSSARSAAAAEPA